MDDINERIASAVMSAVETSEVRRYDLVTLVHMKMDAAGVAGLDEGSDERQRAEGEWQEHYPLARSWTNRGRRLAPTPALRAGVVRYLRMLDAGFADAGLLWEASAKEAA